MLGLAFSTNAFKKNTLDEAVEAIALAGYGGVELMADRPHAYPPEFATENRRRLKERLGELRLSVSNINAFTLFALGDTYHPTWIEDDLTLQQIRIRHTIDAVTMAAEFDCKTVSLQPGGPLIGTILDRKEAGRRFAGGLREVLPVARRLGVTLAVEPEPGLFIETSAEFSAFKNEFFRDEALIRMNCDIGHLFCVGEDPATVIREFPQDIAHVHLEDIGANRVHQHLTPGKGVINFASIFEALDKIDYSGWVTVELYPYETTAAGVARMAIEHLSTILPSRR